MSLETRVCAVVDLSNNLRFFFQSYACVAV